MTKNASLISWSLKGNLVGDHGASCIAKSMLKNKRHCPSEVNLSGCDIGNGGARTWADALPILGARGLRRLEMSCNNIKDDGALDLAVQIEKAEFGPLHLDLRQNNIGELGAGRLVESLTLNSTVAEIQMEGNLLSVTQNNIILGMADVLSRKNKANIERKGKNFKYSFWY